MLWGGLCAKRTREREREREAEREKDKTTKKSLSVFLLYVKTDRRKTELIREFRLVIVWLLLFWVVGSSFEKFHSLPCRIHVRAVEKIKTKEERGGILLCGFFGLSFCVMVLDF